MKYWGDVRLGRRVKLNKDCYTWYINSLNEKTEEKNNYTLIEARLEFLSQNFQFQ